MDETLKTVRLLHQVIIALSAALLAFVLAPQNAEHLDAGLNELRTLRDLDKVSFLRWGADKITRVETPRVRRDAESAFKKVLGLPLADGFVYEPICFPIWPEKTA